MQCNILRCIYYAAYITLHILHCIFTLHILHCIFTLHILHCIYYTAYIALHILHCILPGVIDSCLIHVVLTSFRACDDASLDLLPCPYDLVCPCTQRVRLLCVLVCSLVCTCVLKCVYSCVYSCVLALTCVYSCAHMCIVCTRVLTFQILVSCFGSFRQLGHCEQQL